MAMKNVAAAVSFVAIPLGFASLASLWSNTAVDESNESETTINVDRAIATIKSPHGVNFLYKNLETAAFVLRMGKYHVYKYMSKAIGDEFFNYLDQLERRCIDRTDPDECTIIVIEGLPGSGVTTLVNNLVTYTRACRGASISKELESFEKILSKVPPALGYAFQVICNYAKSIESEALVCDSQEQFLIIERMYHSTCALTICAEIDASTDIASLPPSAFQWPKDLPQPAMVIYLAVPPPDRIARLSAREQAGVIPATVNSAKDATDLQQHYLADARMQLAYSLITGPAIAALDASGSPEEVLETTVQCLEHHSIFIRDDSLSPLPTFTTSGGHSGALSGYDLPMNDSHDQYIAGEEYVDNRKSTSSLRRSSIYGGRESKRQSMGVYGAMLKMDW